MSPSRTTDHRPAAVVAQPLRPGRNGAGRSPTGPSGRVDSRAAGRLVAMGTLFCTSLVLAATILLGLSAVPVAAAEPLERFLGELKTNGYYDLAVAYLESMRSSPVLDDEQRSGIELEIAKVQLELSTHARSARESSEALSQAEQQLRRVLEQGGRDVVTAEASLLLATVLWQRSEIIARDAQQTVEARRAELQRQASESYLTARAAYTDAIQRLREEIEKMPKAIPETETELLETRQRLRAQYVAAIYSEPLMLYESAIRAAPDSSDRRSNLELAIREFQLVADKARKGRYHQQVLLATLHQGRCRMELGQPRLALGYFEELLAIQSSSEWVVSTQLEALAHAMECWKSEEVNAADRVLAEGPAWVERAEKLDVTGQPLQAVRVALAQSAAARLADQGLSSQERSELQRRARRWAADAAKVPGLEQAIARQLLVELGIDTSSTDAAPPTNFAAALALGRQSWDSIQQLTGSLTVLAADSGSHDAADQSQRRQIDQQLAELRQRAVGQFQEALRMVREDVPPEDVAAARNYLAALYYQQEDYLSAAVVADFVAQSQTPPDVARGGAVLAMASIARAVGSLGAAPGSASSELVARLEVWRDTVADEIMRRWPGSEAASEALALRIHMASARGDLNEVDRLLEELPENAPQRGTAELQSGLAHWKQYVDRNSARAAASTAQGASHAASASDDAIRDRVFALLTSGVERSRGDVQPLVMHGVLVLAELCLQRGDVAEAEKWLDDPNLGPRTLLAAEHPAVQESSLIDAIAVVSLRTQVNRLADAQNMNEALEDAQRAMDQLSQRLGTTDEGRQRLAQIYFTVTRDLQRQLAELTPDARRPLANGIEKLLDHVAENSRDVAVLAWAGDTYIELPRAEDAAGGNSTTLTKGLRVYDRLFELLAQATADVAAGSPANSSATAALAYRLRRGKSLARAGHFQLAIDDMANVLRTQPTLLDVQTEAAETLQRWGESGQPDALLDAIRGYGQRDGNTQPPVWGWARIASVTARHPQLRDNFFEARLRVAACRYRLAVLTNDPDVLREARQDITVTRGLYPDLGGDSFRARFEELSSKIEDGLKQAPRTTGTE